jgi:hypothetical protein
VVWPSTRGEREVFHRQCRSPRSPTAPLAGTLRLTAAYMRVDWQGVLLGYGSRPGDVERDEQALRAAKTFFAGAEPGTPGVRF